MNKVHLNGIEIVYEDTYDNALIIALIKNILRNKHISIFIFLIDLNFHGHLQLMNGHTNLVRFFY